MKIEERIQAYLRHTNSHCERTIVPPFTLFTPTNDKDDTFAIPHKPMVDDWSATFGKLREAFAQKQCLPCIQFVEAFAPELPAILKTAGFHQAQASLILSCTQNTFRPVPLIPDLAIVVLSQESTLDEVQEGLNTNELGFNPEVSPLTQEDAASFRRKLITSRAFTVRFNDEPVGAGMFTEVHKGMTQLTGITTLPDYRRKGFAAYLTGYMTKTAFSRGVDAVFLVAADDDASRVYKRVGFQPVSALLTYKTT